MKKFILILLAVILCVCVINGQTDFFLNISSYIPALERYPNAVSGISYFSEGLSDITDNIPSPAQLAAMLRHEELPIDPTDVASNAYIHNSPMLSFYPHENISVRTDGENVRVFGITASKQKQHLVTRISTLDDDVLDQTTIAVDGESEFNRLIEIPQTDEDILELSVYTGQKAYGDFESWVLNYIYLDRTEDGMWRLQPSPVYNNNIEFYEKDKSIKDALKNTVSLQTENETVQSIASDTIQGCNSDYERVRALHDWLCDYLYYDSDSVAKGITLPYSTTEVIKSRKAVCLGFATAFAALCRSVEIPCNVVSGYALGVGQDTQWSEASAKTVEQNHAWNEVYVDGRWIIVDPTWDCVNKIKDGEYTRGVEVSHLYFDANIDFFSANHKILEYLKRW